MQSLISSSQKSVTLSKFREASSYVPLYANEPSFPNLGVQFQRVYPNGGFPAVPHNNSVTFKLPPGAGFMSNMSLQTSCTYTIAADDSIDSPIGINMIRTIEFLANGQPIVSKTGPALWAQVKKWGSSSFQKFSLKHASMLNASEVYASAADTSFITYTPFVDTFLNSAEKFLLLNKIGDLQVRFTFNSVAECGLRTGAGITAATYALFVDTYMPELSVYESMVSADWTNKLLMQNLNTYTEVYTLSSTTTGTGFFYVPFPVCKTHIFVRGITATANIGLDQSRITSITMNVGGTDMISNFPTSRLNERAARHGICSDGVEFVADESNDEIFDNEITTIDWGVLCGREQNSGIYFGQELKGTYFNITFPAVGTAANFRIYACHEYFQNIAYSDGMLQIDSNN